MRQEQERNQSKVRFNKWPEVFGDEFSSEKKQRLAHSYQAAVNKIIGKYYHNEVPKQYRKKRGINHPGMTDLVPELNIKDFRLIFDPNDLQAKCILSMVLKSVSNEFKEPEEFGELAAQINNNLYPADQKLGDLVRDFYATTVHEGR